MSRFLLGAVAMMLWVGVVHPCFDRPALTVLTGSRLAALEVATVPFLMRSDVYFMGSS